MRLLGLQEVGAAELGLKLSEVKTRMRNAREAGFITTGKRGPGAPHMGAKDLAVFMLAMISPIEATAAAHGLREMRRAELQGCEWQNRTQLHANSVASDGERKKWKWDLAPWSPVVSFSERADLPDIVTCLTFFIELIAAKEAEIELREIAFESCADGLKITFEYEEQASPKDMAELFFLASLHDTGVLDDSSRDYFGDSDQPETWRIKAEYRLTESQTDRRTHVIKIDGQILQKLIRQVLGGAANSDQACCHTS